MHTAIENATEIVGGGFTYGSRKLNILEIEVGIERHGESTANDVAVEVVGTLEIVDSVICSTVAVGRIIVLVEDETTIGSIGLSDPKSVAGF